MIAHGSRNVAVGVFGIVLGLVFIVRSRKDGPRAAAFHRRVAKRLPWLYWLPPANLSTSDAWMSIGYLCVGLAMVSGGALALSGIG